MRQTVRHGIRADEDSKVEVRDTGEYAFERRDIARRGNLKRRKTDGLAANLFDPLRQRLRLRRRPRDQHTHAGEWFGIGVHRKTFVPTLSKIQSGVASDSPRSHPRFAGALLPARARALQREAGVSCGHKPCRVWIWRRGAA